jgi:pyridoxal phosphate enzyme (YggS family)
MSFTNDSVREALARVRERIDAVANGRAVSVLAVTKGFGPEAVEAAVAAGCTMIGENYAQELVAKAPVARTAGAEVHFIGRLQTNKVRSLAGIVDVYESVDRPSLVDVLARRVPGARVLLQVDTTGEPDKGGCPVAELGALLERAVDRGLHVEGLMTVGPTHGGPEAARPGFRVVRGLTDEFGLTVCSMGMSDDLEVAVAEGSDRVRIGSALFGPRPVRSRPPGP